MVTAEKNHAVYEAVLAVTKLIYSVVILPAKGCFGLVMMHLLEWTNAVACKKGNHALRTESESRERDLENAAALANGQSWRAQKNAAHGRARGNAHVHCYQGIPSYTISS